MTQPQPLASVERTHEPIDVRGRRSPDEIGSASNEPTHGSADGDRLP